MIAALAPLASYSAPIIVGVLLKGHSDFWTAVGQGAEKAGLQAGATVIIKSPPAETDVAIQVALLRALSEQGISALVIAPTSKETLAGPVTALAAKGVKIVVIDSPLAGDVATTFVGTNQQAAGAAAGRLLAGLVGDEDEVAFLRHNQSGGATLLRETGALVQLHSVHPNVTIHGDVYASTEPGVEADRSQLLLSKYPHAKAIFASGTPGTMAMLQVLTAQKPASSVKLIGCGFDLNPAVVAALKAGTMAGWIAQLPHDIGAKGMKAALAAVAGQTIPSVIPTEFLVVTKDNLDDPKIQGLLAL